MIAAYIGLGSNLADPVDQISQAIKKLSQLPHSKLVAISSLYGSKPWGEGMANQPDYVNAVAGIETTLSASELLSELQALEQQQGRIRTKRYAARTIDCDLLLYGAENIETADLIVPHPQMTYRAFVLVPLLEINPHLVIAGKSLKEHLLNCDLTDLQKLAQ